MKTDGTLWACGNNEYGQLGDGTKEYSEIPIKIIDIDYPKAFSYSGADYLLNEGQTAMVTAIPAGQTDIVMPEQINHYGTLA